MENAPRLRGRVLHVEANPSRRRVVKHVLSRAGATVDAPDGQQRILEALHAGGWDVILIGLDGTGLAPRGALTRVRALAGDTPIVAVIDDAWPADARRGAADAEVRFPYPTSALTRALARFMPHER